MLIKSLLENLDLYRRKYPDEAALDEGIYEMLRQEAIGGDVDIQALIGLFRPQPKIVEVERIVERPVYVNGHLK